MIKSHLVQNEGEKLVIQKGKELSNMKCQSTHGEVFNLPWSNNVSKCNPCIHGRSLFETSKLTRMNKAVGNHMELKTFSNHFFKEFSNCIKKNNGVIWLGRIERCLVRFGNDNCCWSLEMRQPVSQIYIGISNINEFANAVFVSDNRLDMAPYYFIRTWSRQIIAFLNYISKFLLGKWILLSCSLAWNFV